MDQIVKKCCPNCSQFYQIKSISQTKANIPLFLSCGHTMCETCIRNIVKFEEPIECKVCHRDMEVTSSNIALLSQNKIKLYQLFPVNYALLGELTMQLVEKSSDGQKNKASYFIDILSILKSTDSEQGQCMECHTLTSKMCQQCATILCDSCFNKTHKNFIIFKNHVLENIGQPKEANNCPIHKGKTLDYYCKDCLKSICMDCLMVGGEKSCKNHNVVSLQEVNDNFIEEINDIAPKVDETFRRLTKTAADVGHLLYNIENETGSSSELTRMLFNVEQHFSKLSASLQKHKQEILDIIVKLMSAEKESLLKAKDDLTRNIKNSKIILNKINATSGPNKNKINFSILLNEAKQTIATPWYLCRDESDDPLTVIVNEDLCTLLSDYIHLEGNASSTYKLRSASELDDKVEIPPPPPNIVYPPELPKDVRKEKNKSDVNEGAPVFYKEVPKYKCKNSKSGSMSSLNSMDSDNSFWSNMTVFGDEYSQRPTVQQVQPFAETQHPKQLHEGSQELVYITHIVDPHNFFVQRACQQGLVKQMLREFRNASSLPQPSINHITEGKLYLVFNKADDMWQRCRIVSINRNAQFNPKFHVFCMDFGSTEVVRVDQLRLLPPARLYSPHQLAINCCLANCVPKTGNWTNEDAYLIQNIVDNKQAIIHVRNIRSSASYSTTVECDVTTYDYNISLAHALVFHERARMPMPKLPYPKTIGVVEKPKLYINNNDYKPKSVEEVYITQIVSPDKFFVRKKHLQNVCNKLNEDLEQEYGQCGNDGSVYLPEVGTAYVVHLAKQRAPGLGAWARAVVHELPGRGRVRVLLPDCGAVLLVHWSALRHMHHKYSTLSALSTECHLAGVTPLNKKWSPASVALLQKFEDRLLEMHVEDTRRGSVGVTLYDKADEENSICINTEMIRHKFAVTFGLFMFNKNSDIGDQVITNTIPKTEKFSQKPNTKEVLKKQQTPKKIKDEELEAKDKGPLRLEAKLLHYQSPSLLYVSLVHQQKTFNELYDRMQKYYSKIKSPHKKNWAIADRCCAMCNQSQTWRRAVIVELPDKDNAKIFYSDFACLETIPISNLVELTPEFTSIGDAAIKCHLCGITPADGSEEWPTLTKEYLKELLDVYPRIFITKLGNFKNKSMPIEIWVYHTIQGGALEPNKSEWRCLNRKIIEQGLGVPDTSEQALTNSDANHNDMLWFLKNVTGSVNEWLQLDPLPTKSTTQSNSRSLSRPSSPVADDVENLQKTSHNSSTVYISDWLPPEPLQNKEFTAMPTYIDNDGTIYLHDITQEDTLDLIRKALDVRFKSPDPKDKYAKWNVGEPCIAMFFLDNQFYRGRILEVNTENSTCVVHYIDYGNEEVCSFQNLRKSIALYQIPTQAHKCMLARVRPVGEQWDRQTLDYIHKSIVEKHCFIKIKGEPVNGIIPIELKYDKLWINDHLVDFEMAVYTDGTKALVRKFAPPEIIEQVVEPTIIDIDSGLDYVIEDDQTVSEPSCDAMSLDGKDWCMLVENEEKKAMEGKFITFPANKEENFICNITIINSTKTLELNKMHDKPTSIAYEQMYEIIQSESEALPPLDGIFENKACIALYNDDNQWYRASILQYSESENLIKVRYVDYGNVEIVSLADIREIPEKLTMLPPATVSAKLYGIEIKSDVDKKILSELFADTFLDKGPFHAKIIDYEDSIPLVELRNENGSLVYEDIIKCGVFIKREAMRN